MLEQVTLNNIHLRCKAKNKMEVLAIIGKQFHDVKATSQDCTSFLVEREKQVSTFLGNGIVLPHLPKSAKAIILNTSIEIFQFPEGVIWDRCNVMFIAIGVIAKEKEHIAVLKDVGTIFSNELIANALSLLSNKEDFLRIIKKSN